MSQSSVQILADSLEKKNQILDQLIGLLKKQEDVLKADALDMDALNSLLEEQGGLIEQLDKLDAGFEALYERTREEIQANRDTYRSEIKRMQEAISRITAKVVSINADNMRNKKLADSRFRDEKQTIAQNLSKNRAAKDYYNSMNRLNHIPPQFYDNKK